MRRTFVAIILAGLTTSTLWSQTPTEKKRALPDFDIRELDARGQPLQGKLPEDTLADSRRADLQSFMAAPEEARLGTRIVANEYGLPKILRREGQSLTGPSTRAPQEIGKDFLRARSSMFRLSPVEVDRLRISVEDITDKASFLAFNQTVNGIDVFNGQIKFTLNKNGEVIQVSTGTVVPGLNISTNPKLTPRDAVEAAFGTIGNTVHADLTPTKDPSGRAAFLNPVDADYSAITAELSVFPMSSSTARLAYRIFLEVGPETWYETLIDANSGTLLFRHNLYSYAAQARVWTRDPSKGERTLVTFPDGWMSDTTVTTGNNVDAFLDTNADNNPDTTTDPNLKNGRAYNAGSVFDFPFVDGLQGGNPRLYQPAAVTNLFYFVNAAHDYYYNLGFNEAAGNFQTDNFGKGGLGNDAIKASAQYGGFTNNGVFSSTPEGTAPRIRLGLFTRGTSSLTDDLDSDNDAQIIFHEYGHGVSNRLIGAKSSTSCLGGIQSGGMGEGWSDYFSNSYTNDPIQGAYLTQNTTRGVRRQSYEGYTLTYEDIGNQGYEVHNDGEIWVATLWDIRKTLGQAVTDKLVIDGLKGTPCNPSMTDARDAIISADLATNAGANRNALWTVFARHGLGSSAVGVDGSTATGTRYDAAYDLPTVIQTNLNPAITSNPLSLKVGLGESYRYNITASNPAAGTLNYVLSSGPSGMTVDNTGFVNWTTGFYPSRVKITVTDGKGGKIVHGYLLVPSTTLADNVTVTVSGASNDTGSATFTVPANASILQVTLRNGTGDADVAINDPAGAIYVSQRSGSSETLSVANPRSGAWQVLVHGSSAHTGVSLKAAVLTPTALNANASMTLSGDLSSETFYKITIPSGSTSLAINTSGGTGDVDLFLKRGSLATCQASLLVIAPCTRDASSSHDGSAESITISNPAAGDWYLDVQGYAAYSGVKLDIVTAVPPAAPVSVALTAGGAATTTTTETSSAVTTGYATASVASGAAPFATAVFTLTQNGIVVSEAGIPSSPPTTSARIFIDYRNGVSSGSGSLNISTGIAMVNRGTASASLTYTLRDLSGQVVTRGTGTLAAGAHVGKMVYELKDIAPDFNLPATFPTTTLYGSLEIASTQPVSLLALRLTANQRGEVLLTSTPVADMTKTASTSALYFPQIVDGGGYVTAVTLLNTSAATETGTIALFTDTGSPLTVKNSSGTSAATFSYSIPASGAFVFRTDGSPSGATAGWLKITPDSGTSAPVGAGVFSYTSKGILVTESGVPSAVPTTKARVYVDKSKGHDTGIAIANAGTASAPITIRAFQPNGTTSAGSGPASLSVAANGHRAAFAGELISGLPDGFTGVAEISSTVPFVALTLRSLVNGRQDFLLTTFPIADANQTAPAPIVFPQIAAGGGYSTQFIFISAAGDGSVSLSFFGEDGLSANIAHNP